MGTGFFTAAQILLLYQAIVRISAPLATLLLYAYPAPVALLSVTVLRERLGHAKTAAILVSLAGIMLIVGLPSGRVTVAGCLCGLGAGLCLAIYIVLVSRWPGISSLSGPQPGYSSARWSPSPWFSRC